MTTHRVTRPATAMTGRHTGAGRPAPARRSAGACSSACGAGRRVGPGRRAVVARVHTVQSTLAAHDRTGLSSLIPGGGWRYYTVTDDYPAVDHADLSAFRPRTGEQAADL